MTQRQRRGRDSNPARVMLTFNVPAGASEQYLDIKNIIVTPGKCESLMME